MDVRLKWGITNGARVERLAPLPVLLVALLPAFIARAADACPRQRGAAAAPIVEEAGFDPVSATTRGESGGTLWVRFAPTPAHHHPTSYTMELVGGRAPTSLGDWWGRPLVAHRDELLVPVRSSATLGELTPGGPVVFGFQVRTVGTDGRAGHPSEPIWIAFDPERPARAASDAPRSDHVLFFLLAVGLGFLWYWYRREPSAESKIRLAALAALGSVVFLSVTAAMPWLVVRAGDAGRVSLECLLGQETACAYRASPGMLSAATSDPEIFARVAFELQRWQCASAALRMGQVTALALLLPALIWLLVDPRHRAAQASAAVGASVAGFTFMVVLLYRFSIPRWVASEIYWTSDIALMTTSVIVVAAILIVRQSFAFLGRAPVPLATARYTRRRRP